MQNSANVELEAVQKCANIVDVEKSCRIVSEDKYLLEKSAPIQPRTSPDKFALRLEFASPDLESFPS